MNNVTRSVLLLALLLSFIAGSSTPSAHAQVSLPAEINKSFSPISISVGQTSRLSVSIFNPNSFQLTNASWTDNLAGVQPGIRIASAANLSNSCGGAVSASPGATTFSLSGGIVPAQSGVNPGSCTVSIDVTSTTQGNLINTIPAGALSATGGGFAITNTTPASATLRVGAVQGPRVTKSFSPNVVFVGQTSRLTIVIQNTDPSVTLTQTSLTDNLPTNVSLATPVNSSLSSGCGPAASVSASSGGSTVTFNNGSIAPNSTCTIQVDVISNTSGVHTNTIPPNALQNNQGLTNPSPATARLTVQDVAIAKSFSPGSLAAGGVTTLTITLQNPTGRDYTGVSISDTLPGTVLTYVPGSETTNCGGSVTITPPRTLTLTGGTIPRSASPPLPPGTCTITVQVSAPAGSPSGTFRNIIPARTMTTNEGVTNIRAAQADVTISGSNMTGTKSFSPSTISAGAHSRLRIDINAPGDTSLTNFSMTDNLPAGVTISNSTAATTSGCGAGAVLTAVMGATTVSLTGGTVAAGTRCRINVYVTSTTTGVHSNIVPPANIRNDQNRTLASDLTANLTVSTSSGLSIEVVKGFNPLTVFGGSASTMSILLINPNTTPLSGISFTDTMPAGMILANPVNFSTGTCGGSLAGSPGASSFSFSGGSLGAGASCTLNVSVTMTVNGNLTNTIGAAAVTTTQGATNPDPAEASLTNLPGASISKSFAPNPMPAGGVSILTITIRNTGNIPLTGLGLSDTLPGTLPAGLEIAGGAAPAPVNNCGGTLTAVPGTQTIQLANGALGASSTCTMEISVTGSTPGNYENRIPIGALINQQGAQNNQPASDTLQITGAVSGLSKTVDPPQATIGEMVTYEVNVTIPPGALSNAQLVDTMERGLAFVDCDSISAPGLTTDVAGGFSAICQNPTADDAGGTTSEDIDRRVTFDFGTLTNNGAQDVTLTVTYRAIVLDIVSNLDGDSLLNSALWTWSGGSSGPVQTTVNILEPKLTVDKTADNTFISNGTEATIILTLSHTADSHLDAYDVVLTDPLPQGLDYVANSLDCTTGAQDPATCVLDMTDPSKPTIRAEWSVFNRAGGTGVIRFRVAGNALLSPSGNVTNVANVEWTSLPGDHSTPQSFSQPPNPFAVERFFDPGSSVNFYGDSDPFIFNPVGGAPPNVADDPNERRGRTAALGGFLIPVTGFAPGQVTPLVSLRPAYASTGLILEITKFDLSIPIVGVPMQNATWNVDWLFSQAGWLQKTAYPTFPGNSVVTAHDVTADGFAGPFARIKWLTAGDYVFVYLGNYRYTYEVASVSRVAPDDISILRHEEDSWLTLVTCDNYDAKTDTYLNRTVVRTKLIDIDYR